MVGGRLITIGLLSSIIISAAILIYVFVVVPLRLSKVTYGVSVETVKGGLVYLPPPHKVTTVSVEEAILQRRSIRDYTNEPIKLDYLSMILWAAYGITDPSWGFRASPSAGATYPLEIYVVVGKRGVVLSNGSYLEAGVYRYDYNRHVLILVKEGEFKEQLYEAALNQRWVLNAPVNIVICAVYERTTRVYGERGVRYVHMEVGHVGENIYLMATALGLGTVAVGAFYDDKVAQIIGTGCEAPLYIMPIGVPAEHRKVGFTDIANYIIKARGG
ncbi:SagB/ThcOx family dehydrogenase [Caldivirga sp.]|uniref:SagB/ThcOx family dehydrogenase n=1 Tax=Caldivirga sp. TaxID=2080243 RepID=UPI003D147754